MGKGGDGSPAAALPTPAAGYHTVYSWDQVRHFSDTLQYYTLAYFMWQFLNSGYILSKILNTIHSSKHINSFIFLTQSFSHSVKTTGLDDITVLADSKNQCFFILQTFDLTQSRFGSMLQWTVSGS